MKIFMQGFTGILFQVGMMNADTLGAAIFQGNFNLTRADDGVVHLAGLVTLGQVRVEVIFTVKDRDFGDICMHRQAKLHGHGHGLLIEHWQHAGQA